MKHTLMTAEDVLKAIKRKHSGTAIVPELSIEDYDLPDSGEQTTSLDMSLSEMPDEHKYIRRIDALMFDSLVRTAIEIKVTKEDFYRDTYWKRRAWKNVTHRFVYAVPHYLDVMSPHGCALWKVQEDGSIKVIKKAIMNNTPDPLPQTVIQRLAYRAMKS